MECTFYSTIFLCILTLSWLIYYDLPFDFSNTLQSMYHGMWDNDQMTCHKFFLRQVDLLLYLEEYSTFSLKVYFTVSKSFSHFCTLWCILSFCALSSSKRERTTCKQTPFNTFVVLKQIMCISIKNSRNISSVRFKFWSYS